jgi:hypothetical protein
MMPERRNSGVRETAVARERLGEHIIVSSTAVTSREGSDVATRIL